MSISVNVISVTKNISINTAELGVARSPITVTDSNKLLIINNVLTQDIVAKKSTNIPVGVDYFNYSAVNDERLSNNITIKSQTSINFGEEDSANFSSVGPTVINTTFNDAQPESAPMLSQLFSKKIMVGPDTLAYSLTRVITTTTGINVVKDQELGLFVDGNGRAIVAVLNNDNDPRIVLEPSVSVVAGPVQQWF
jgi:hypothetical protein